MCSAQKPTTRDGLALSSLSRNHFGSRSIFVKTSSALYSVGEKPDLLPIGILHEGVLSNLSSVAIPSACAINIRGFEQHGHALEHLLICHLNRVNVMAFMQVDTV